MAKLHKLGNTVTGPNEPHEPIGWLTFINWSISFHILYCAEINVSFFFQLPNWPNMNTEIYQTHSWAVYAKLISSKQYGTNYCWGSFISFIKWTGKCVWFILTSWNGPNVDMFSLFVNALTKYFVRMAVWIIETRCF